MIEPTPIFDELRDRYIVQRVLDSPAGKRWMKRETDRLRSWMAHPATRAKYGSDR